MGKVARWRSQRRMHEKSGTGLSARLSLTFQDLIIQR
jgi:hypothetical protein